jgi:multidrug transporter EmrE-like cation transporter
MALTWPVVLAVLCGAALHAGWNALVKSAGDKTVDTALVHFLGALVALPFALWVGLPRPESWPYIAASLFIHIGYYIALAGAYRHGELGITYPIMRGFAPLLVASAARRWSARRPRPRPGPASWASPSAWRWWGWPIRGRRCTTARRWPLPLPTPPSSPATPSSTAWACARSSRWAAR